MTTKVAYFDCFSGASGDMILGALLDAGLELSALAEQLEKLGLEGYELKAEKTSRLGFAGTKFEVLVAERGHDEESGHHHERHLGDIRSMIQASSLGDSVKGRSIAVFERLAEAEATVHGKEPDEVHFHEVGAVDSIIDIVGAAIALELLGIEEVICSPLRTGTGYVECRHGRLPVPAPGTAELLKGYPVAPTDVPAELTTPTGAAILTTLAAGFGPCPQMQVGSVGYGAGRRETEPIPNLLRVFIGERSDRYLTDTAIVIETNLDDMSPELIGHLAQKLLDLGALDVYSVPIYMKKGRPGVLLSVIAEPQDASRLEEAVLLESTSFGVRKYEVQRQKLAREHVTVATEYGEARVKLGKIGGEVKKAAPEYEDCKKLADERGVPLREVYRAVMAALP